MPHRHAQLFRRRRSARIGVEPGAFSTGAMMVDDAVVSVPLVTRTLSATGELEGSLRVLGLKRTLDAPIDVVWDACTSWERIERWFAPITGDRQVGGRYQVEGNAGGEVLTCAAPRSLAATWEFGGESSVVAIELTESGQCTVLEFTHTVDAGTDHWREYGPGAVGVGWDMGLLGLARHVEEGYDTPIEVPEWMSSDDAETFVAATSAAWGQAAVAAGDDVAASEAAAARTRTAYTA